HRQDHAPQIWSRQSRTAFPRQIHPAYIDLVQRRGAADSWQKQRGGIEAVFSVPREPVTQRPRERRGKIGETYADQKPFFFACRRCHFITVACRYPTACCRDPIRCRAVAKARTGRQPATKAQWRALTGGFGTKEAQAYDACGLGVR